MENKTTTEKSLGRRNKISYIVTWSAFVLAIPVFTFLGVLAAKRQDVAGRGMSVGFGLLLGELVALIMAILLTVKTPQRKNDHSILHTAIIVAIPWLVVIFHFWIVAFTSIGDRYFEFLERLV